jgi:hypothetical protein
VVNYKSDTAACCKQLRLSTNLAERAMNQKGEFNQEYLLNLLQAEMAYRTHIRISKMLNTAGSPRRYRFDILGQMKYSFHLT